MTEREKRALSEDAVATTRNRALTNSPPSSESSSDEVGASASPTDPAASAPRSEETGDEDIAAAIDGLITPTGAFQAPSPQERLAYERQTEAELKEMFSNIVWEFLQPVGLSLHTLSDYVGRAGEGAEKSRIIHGTIDACIGALRPLIKASETIRYHDIVDVLKTIERPLMEMQSGKRKALAERDTKNLMRDFNELDRLIRQSLPVPMPPSVVKDGSVERIPSTSANLRLSDVLSHFKAIDPSDIQKLYAAGITRLSELGTASAQEIAQATGVPLGVAERIKSCAFTALMQPATSVTANGWNRSADAASFEYAEMAEDVEASAFENSSGRSMYFPEEDGESSDARAPIINTLDVMQKEIASYGQSATRLNVELQRTHRALLRLRVERERLRGEVEFHRDELRHTLENGGGNSEATQTAVVRHKGLSQELRQVSEIILAAMKKMDIIYGQMEDAIRDIRDLEIEMADLRRKRRTPRTRGRSDAEAGD